MLIGRAIGLFLIPLVLGVVFFNGLVMLVSPARWFMLPGYIALRGSLRRRTYMASRWGRFQVRVLGLVLAALTGWMIISFFGTHYARSAETSSSLTNSWLCVATSIGAIGCGLAMLLKTSWWVGKYFSEVSDARNQVVLERTIRIVGVPCIVIGIYFLLQCAALWRMAGP